jgi:hypothetical protein
MGEYFWPNLLIALFIGVIAAFAELLSRYKTIAPILCSWPSNLYLLINSISSGIAYYFIVRFNVIENEVWRVVLAGTSSIVILRSSFANIKVGDKNIDAGIGAIVQVFLNYADRSFDQIRAENDLIEIKKIMSEVDFDKAKLALPVTCFIIMKNISIEEQDKISRDVKVLTDHNLDNLTKSINLGIILAGVTKTKLLAKAVESLEESIKYNPVDSGVVNQSITEQLDSIINSMNRNV